MATKYENGDPNRQTVMEIYRAIRRWMRDIDAGKEIAADCEMEEIVRTAQRGWGNKDCFNCAEKVRFEKLRKAVNLSALRLDQETRKMFAQALREAMR